MTPFFTLLAYLKLNDPPFLRFSSPEWPPFLSFPFTQLPPPFFDLQMIYSNYLGTFLFANLVCF